MITNKKITEDIERITCQKEIILNYLKSVKTHPSVEDVYLAARKKLPRISRGTVYRILGNFLKKREIIEIPQEVSRYDGDISSHAHFICQNCGQIFDVSDACKECKIIKRRRVKLGKIQRYNLYFYGICKNCQK